MFVGKYFEMEVFMGIDCVVLYFVFFVRSGFGGMLVSLDRSVYIMMVFGSFVLLSELLLMNFGVRVNSVFVLINMDSSNGFVLGEIY